MPDTNWKRQFFSFWGAQAVSLLGSGLASFALIWWMTVSTQSATVLALASLAGMLPGVLIGPLAGALVDRWDRKWVMIVSDGVSAILAALLVALFWLQPSRSGIYICSLPYGAWRVPSNSRLYSPPQR
jgi:DHA3 family macrolide efflux protein-like MFS transporter